jgi:alanine dehydrogenase
MLIGVPKEIKNHEYRVGLTPASVRELTAHGHQVLVQTDAGTAIDLTDAQYVAAGAEMVATAAEIFARAEMIVKVKEPQPVECAMLRPGQILYTYLHLAPDPEQTGAGQVRCHLHRLRDHHRPWRRFALAGADERSGRAHGGAGRRHLP